MLLVGDRNVTNGVAPQKNVLTLNTTQPAGWTEKLHRKAGNIGFTDGRVIPSTTRELRARLEKADGVDIRTQRIQLPE